MLHLFLLIPVNALGVDEGCRNCHSGQKATELGLQDVYAGIEKLKYRHTPVVNGCAQCHVAAGLRSSRSWELSSPYYDSETIFPLQGFSMDRKYDLELAVRDASGNKAEPYRLSVVPSGITTVLGADDRQKQPSAVTEAAVEDIRQAVFVEAVISWTTDEPSNAVVEYGLTTDYGERVSEERIFTRAHSVKIGGLVAGKRYNYRITSRNIFGYAGVSKNFIINSLEPVTKPAPSAARDRHIPEVKDVKVFKVSGSWDIYLRLIADKPVRAALKINEPSEMDWHGFGLLPAGVSRINVCVKCHNQGISHPVGVRSRSADIRIPVELPTIEGGMITCVTCHFPHGGDNEYFARMDFKRELCVGCHKGAAY